MSAQHIRRDENPEGGHARQRADRLSVSSWLYSLSSSAGRSVRIKAPAAELALPLQAVRQFLEDRKGREFDPA